MTAPTPPEEPGWHLDKRVPVAIIFAMVAQIVGFAVMISDMRSQIASTVRDVSRLDVQVEQTRTTASAQAVQLGRIEENTRATQQDVARLLRQLEEKP